ncbi:electron transfer flavoprotein alpha subunit [Thalassobacillus cyri]|uniref:Electron transfer flavoprotein alpha subunit n=1 Tax=Thalassobacillus cyri TaxID=571932 RepID=A0A1H4H112_9BACI|nr:electron transfer flavoprotein subunit alpha/FixB family protein [Thalassobacillus cyri]SEB14692.1 electron transfer flavoprotein alpha subunit [Thalassobacillus cyri]
MSKNVLVFAEARDDELRNVSFEALGAAREIANGGEVIGAIVGADNHHLAEELFHYGADRVISAEHEVLSDYTNDGYFQAYLQVVDSVSPDVILLGHTSLGKDLSPRLAARLNLGLISDVTDFEVEEGEVIFTRPIYSGKAFEKKRVKSGTIFATIRPNNIASLDKDNARTGQVEFEQVTITDLRTILKDIVKKTASGVDLSEAKVIVAGGRGVRSSEGFKPLEELAEELGGTVGASRGACDAEYCDYSLQIGQTGKVVTPELYIACGISGAIQHLAGMSNSKVIVAINKDPEANIFNVADYGIVGDLFEVVPLLTEEIRHMKVGV